VSATRATGTAVLNARGSWLRCVQWLLLTVGMLLSAVYLAWIALAQVNFLYPLWHDLIGIDHTVETYAPLNRYKAGFERTSKAERSRLFGGIVDAIHAQGKGLHKLVYHDASGQPLGKLLRGPEIVHLRDVAGLIDVVRPVGIGALLVAIALLMFARRQNLVMPPVASLLGWLALPAGAAALAALLAGPVKIFYWLHTLVFPPGHQWFFHYQESLMSTMMKAPDLFGYIALVWAALTLLLLIALMGVVRRINRAT
jgi:hypothetical protein